MPERMTVDDIIRLLDLRPHAEGGHFRETFRDAGAPRGARSAATRPLSRYTLVGCTVAPAFTFEGFEMAPPDWRPA